MIFGLFGKKKEEPADTAGLIKGLQRQISKLSNRVENLEAVNSKPVKPQSCKPVVVKTKKRKLRQGKGATIRKDWDANPNYKVSLYFVEGQAQNHFFRANNNGEAREFAMQLIRDLDLDDFYRAKVGKTKDGKTITHDHSTYLGFPHKKTNNLVFKQCDNKERVIKTAKDYSYSFTSSSVPAVDATEREAMNVVFPKFITSSGQATVVKVEEFK